MAVSINRWLGLISGMWLLACTGSSATFAIYSPALKAIGSYDQSHINSLAVAKDVGDSVGLLPGLLCDWLPLWALISIGAAHYLIGFGALFLVVTGRIPPLPFPQMWALMLIGCQGTAWFNTTVIVTNLRNFPKSRGTVVGILKGLVGLSGAIFTQIYITTFAPNQAGFLSLIALLPSLFSIPAMLLLRPVAEESKERDAREQEAEKKGLQMIITTFLLLAVYLLTTALLQDSLDLSQVTLKAILGGMYAFLLVPLAVPLSQYMQPSMAEEENDHGGDTGWQVLGRGSHGYSRPENEGLKQLLLPRERSMDPNPSIERTFSGDSLFSDSSVLSDSCPNLTDLGLPAEPHHGNGHPASIVTSGEIVTSSAESHERHDDRRFQDKSEGIDDVQDATIAVLDEEARGRMLLESHYSATQNQLGCSLRSENSIDKSQMHDDGRDETSLPLQTPTTTPSKEECLRARSLKRRESQILLAVGEGAVRVRRRKGPRRGENFTVLQAMMKADFWLLFLSFLCGCGSGLTGINNLAQMGAAQGFEDVKAFVAMVSVWNFIGRLTAGFISEHLVKDYALPRPILLLLAQALMAAGNLLFAFALPFSMHVGSVIVGLCYGVHWGIMPATASELFGLKNFGMIFNVMSMACPLGSFLFSGLLAGYLYDHEADSSDQLSSLLPLSHVRAAWPRVWGFTAAHAGIDRQHCYGAHCFQGTFLIMTAVCLVGLALSGLLVKRTMVVYRSLYGGQHSR